MKDKVTQNSWTPAIVIGLLVILFVVSRSDPAPEMRLRELERWRIQHDHDTLAQVQLLNDIKTQCAVQAKAAGFMESWLRASGNGASK